LWPATGPLRKRQRTVYNGSEKETTLRIHRGGSFEGVEKAVQELARSRRNVLQQAVELLEDKYLQRLTSEHMDIALDFLENEAKASIFTGIRDEGTRDRWLVRHSGVEFLD